MKNFILCLVACCTFLLFGFESKAATYTLEVGYPEPSYTDTSGYINVIVRTSGGGLYCQTWFWNISNYIGGSSVMDININGNTITFVPTTAGPIEGFENATGHYYLANYYTNGRINFVSSGVGDTGLDSYTYTLDDGQIWFVIPKGNVRLRGMPERNDNFNVLFGTDSMMYNTLQDIISIISQEKTLLDTYIPKLNKMEFGVTEMYQLMQLIQEDIEFYYPEMRSELQFINGKLDDIKEYLKHQTQAEQDAMNNFGDSSSSQSGALNDLNAQTQVDKPNVDDMSNTVDQNLNVDIDANYGMLLSTFTKNNRILTILLMVASVSLISYVLFGKR